MQAVAVSYFVINKCIDRLLASCVIHGRLLTFDSVNPLSVDKNSKAYLAEEFNEICVNQDIPSYAMGN